MSTERRSEDVSLRSWNGKEAIEEELKAALIRKEN